MQISNASHSIRQAPLLVLIAILIGATLVGAGLRTASADGPTNGIFLFANTTGTPQISLTVTEGQVACINVHRSSGTQGEQQVTINRIAGSAADVDGFNQLILTFPQAVINRTIDPLGPGLCLQTTDNAVVDGQRTVVFEIGLITGGGVAAASNTSFTLTINDNDGPQVTGLQPHSGPTAGANSVVITGSGFTGATAVHFGANPATFAVNSNNQITATAPAGVAGTVQVKVTVGAVESANTAADDYVYFDGPRVHSVSPNTGPAAGGTVITVTGENLGSATGVTVGGNACAPITSNIATSLQCTTPARGINPNLVDVRVTTGSGISPNTPNDDFTYTGAPTITSVTPASGTTAGGTVVTFTGTNLTGTTSASLGGANCTPITGLSSTSFQCTTGAHAAGLVQAAIANPAGNATLNNAFTYTGAPTVTNVTPSTCSSAGGSTVTVTGTGFVTGVGNTTVLFGAVAGTNVTVFGPTSLTVTCPAQGAGVVDVRVTTAVGTSPNTANDDFTYTATGLIPTVTNVNPGAGPITGGTAITITGTNFVGTPTVTVGGSACTSVVLVSPTTITCVTPAHAAGQVEVIVTTTNGSNVTTGTANDFTYTTGPTVTSITPNTGPAAGATIVTITGTNFTASGLIVRFGTVTATANFISSTTIVAVAPAQSAGVVDVTVQTPGGTSPNTSADDFTYTGVSVPAVTSISPTSGPIGTTVVITGTGFTGATSVTFGGVAATFTVNSPTQITATVPNGAPSGSIDVRVTGPGGQSPNTANDNFNNTSAAANITYTLYFRFTLIVWTGADNRSIQAALAGGTAGTNNVSGLIGAIWLFNPQTQTWGGYFPGSENVPGANNFTTFRNGSAYFIGLKSAAGAPITWTTSGGQ